MLREPLKPDDSVPPTRDTNDKPRRFKIVKLEERIAPGGGHGNGSNFSCGNACDGGGTKRCGKF